MVISREGKCPGGGANILHCRYPMHHAGSKSNHIKHHTETERCVLSLLCSIKTYVTRGRCRILSIRRRTRPTIMKMVHCGNDDDRFRYATTKTSTRDARYTDIYRHRGIGVSNRNDGKCDMTTFTNYRTVVIHQPVYFPFLHFFLMISPFRSPIFCTAFPPHKLPTDFHHFPHCPLIPIGLATNFYCATPC